MPTRNALRCARMITFMVVLLSPFAALVPCRGNGEEDARLLQEYIKDARRRYGYHTTDTGLLFLLITSGKGARPLSADRVVVSLTALAPDDGKTVMPHLSVAKGNVAVKDLLPGLSEAVQMMAVGSEARVLLVPELTFGKGAWPAGLEPGSPMIFQIVLHDVIPARGAHP